MSEMVEKVARELREAVRNGPDVSVPFEEMSLILARVALEAMREPTASMIEAMDEYVGTIAPQYAYEAAIDAALSGETK